MIRTINKILAAIAENNIVAVWSKGHFCDVTGDYRECLYVRIGSFEENEWYKFFPEEEEIWEMLPQELFEIAVDEYEEEDEIG